ncbi:hypothetical protein [Nocardiopsis ganjiahuensis]|uniref:hypothetical protein n=1 Tax=Nocardiopsis ganjiahuensis TaxID=239984 RepID=UPI000476B012|nr:hypothetical protein [Nocardiopsis ganjiahuensis]
MSGEHASPPADRAAFYAWSRAHGVRVRVACEDWQSITYETVGTGPDGKPVVQRLRCELPPQVARRRLRLSYVVGLSHVVDGAVCNHVRTVTPPVLTSGEVAARHDVSLVAAALVEGERRGLCGATVENLSVYVVERAANWRPF